jgi:hypothetical protein
MDSNTLLATVVNILFEQASLVRQELATRTLIIIVNRTLREKTIATELILRKVLEVCDNRWRTTSTLRLSYSTKAKMVIFPTKIS